VGTSLGIDLASQNRKTASCLIDWRPFHAHVYVPQVGIPNGSELDWLVELSEAATWVGIDAPFGWPEPMVHAISQWAHGEPWPGLDSRDLRLRLTDQAVHEHTGLTPLSVSSDRIAIVAWRCAQLLTRLATNSRPIDRAGSDCVYEVYPAAALRCWDLNHVGYKARGDAAAKNEQSMARAALVKELSARAPWLDLTAATEACVASDDALDALLVALVARAAGIAQTIPPPSSGEAAERVAREGWIQLPKPGSLEQLL
jgi:predicted nuclease with RNAse H fold